MQKGLWRISQKWAALSCVAILASCASKNGGNTDRQESDIALGDIPVESASPSDSQGHSSGQAYRKSKRPVIHSMPLRQGEHWLNSFYVLTSEQESWQSLSQKFYGRSDRAGLLQNWNLSTPLNSGAIVYYNSPFRPQDRERMLSFAEDFGQRAEAYVVRKGDTLSKLAGQLWGNVHAWPAIAAINPQIAHPDVIQIGQTIALPPFVNSESILATLKTQSSNFNEDAAFEADSSIAGSTHSADSAAPAASSEDAPRSPSDKQPHMPMRSSTLIVLAGIILILSSLIYLLWKKAQRAELEPVAYTEHATDELDKPDTMTKLSTLIKTKWKS